MNVYVSIINGEGKKGVGRTENLQGHMIGESLRRLIS